MEKHFVVCPKDPLVTPGPGIVGCAETCLMCLDPALTSGYKGLPGEADRSESSECSAEGVRARTCVVWWEIIVLLEMVHEM